MYQILVGLLEAEHEDIAKAPRADDMNDVLETTQKLLRAQFARQGVADAAAQVRPRRHRTIQSRGATRDGCGCWSGECRARAACGCHENTTEPLPCCLASSVKSFFCARGGAEVYGVCVWRVFG